MFQMYRGIRYRLIDWTRSASALRSSVLQRGFVFGWVLAAILTVWMIFLHGVIGFLSLPVIWTNSPTASYTILARFSPEKGFIDSYNQHLKYYRNSVASVTLVIALIAVRIIAFFAVSYFTVGQPQAAQAATNHLIGFWDGGAAPSGWSCISCSPGDAFYQKFPRGSATYGGTGGATTATHSVSWALSANASGNDFTGGGSGTSYGSTTHRHNSITSGSTVAATTLPVYQNMKVIRSDSTGDPATIPSGFIGMFDATPPVGWTAISSHNSDFLYGENDATGTGGSATHTHSTSITTGNNATSTSSSSDVAGAGTLALSPHTHTGSGTTASGDQTPLYRDVILGKADSTTTIPNGLIVLQDAAPGTPWTVLSGSGGVFDSRFLRGAASYGGTGGAATHTHTNLGITTSSVSSTETSDSTLGTQASGGTHTNLITVSFGSASNLPPYEDVIVAKYAVVTVSGTIRQADETTAFNCSSTNLTVNVSVNGGANTSTTCTSAGGTFSVNVPTPSAAGDPIAVSIDNANAASYKGTTVTLAADTTSNVASLDIFQNRVVVTYENAGPMTNAKLATASNADAGIRYSVASSNLTVESGIELHVKNGKTFTPGGTVTTNTSGGDLHIDDNAIATLDTASNTIGSDILVDTGATLNINASTTVTGGDITTAGTGTVANTSGTPTTTLGATGGVGGGSGAIAFYALTQNGGTTTINSDVSVTNTLTVNTGNTVSLASGKTLTSGTAGTVTINGTGIISGSGTLTVQNSNLGTGGTLSSPVRFDATSGNINEPARTYGGLVEIYSNSAASARSVTMTAGTHTLSGALNLIAANTQNITLNATTNDPTLNLTGDFDFTGAGAGTEIVQAPDTGSVTWTVSGNVNFTDGTYTQGTETLAMNGTSKTLTSASQTLYDFTVSGGSITLGDALDLNHNFTLSGGTFDANAKTITVRGQFSNAVAGSATTWTGSTLYLNGSNSMYDINTKVSGGDTYGTLRIGATDSVAMWSSDATSITIDSGACLFSEDHATTLGRLNIYGTCTARTNEYWTYATNFDGTANGSPRLADVRFASGATLTVGSSSTLTILGQSASANRTLVTRQSSGNFGLTINGTINARYYDVDYLNASGLNIGSTATVSNLSDGSFDNIASGASAAYITVTNATTTGTFGNVVFDSATDGTDANVVYGVNASGSGISWTFSTASGNKAGTANTRAVSGASVTWSTAISAVNDGTGTDQDLTKSGTSLSANWTVSDGSGIDHYTYAIGTTSGGSDVVSYTSTGTSTSVTKSGLSLTNDVTYYFTVRALDASNDLIAQASSNGITVDTQAATFSSISAAANSTGATITWTSSEGTSTLLRYGTTTSYGTQTTEVATLTTSHSVTLSALATGTTFHYQVEGSDRAGNVTTSSDQTFSTTSSSSTVITNVTVTVVSSTSVQVTWTTNEAADSKVRYGVTTDYGSEKYDATLVTSHELTLTGLTANTQYHYEVISSGSTVAIDADATFSTPAASTTAPAAPSDVTINGTPSSGVTINQSKTGSFTLAGTAEPNATITVEFVGSGLTFSTTTDSAGAWQIIVRLPTSMLDFGTYSLLATVTKAGLSTTSTIGTVTITSPNYLPAPTITVPAEGATVTTGQPAIRGLAKSDNLIRVFIDGTFDGRTKATTGTGGTGTFFYRSAKTLSGGSHTLVMVAVDGNGTASANSATRTFIVSRPFVTPTLFEPLVSNGVNPAVTIRGVAWDGSRIHVLLDGKDVAQFTVTATTGKTNSFSYRLSLKNVPDGEHSIVLVAYDANGKAANPTRSVTFTKMLSDIKQEPSFNFDSTVSYSVKSGDSLWSIAERFYGNGGRYTTIAAANSATFPSLATSPSVIQVGWVLHLPPL